LSPEPTSLLQGTLDLLILKSLIAGEMHGLGLSRRIQQITSGTLRLLWRHARTYILLGEHFKVCVNLLVEVRFHTTR